MAGPDRLDRQKLVFGACTELGQATWLAYTLLAMGLSNRWLQLMRGSERTVERTHSVGYPGVVAPVAEEMVSAVQAVIPSAAHPQDSPFVPSSEPNIDSTRTPSQIHETSLEQPISPGSPVHVAKRPASPAYAQPKDEPQHPPSATTEHAEVELCTAPEQSTVDTAPTSKLQQRLHRYDLVICDGLPSVQGMEHCKQGTAVSKTRCFNRGEHEAITD